MTESKLDGRSSVEVELDREEWYQLMMLAHERDITLNQLVENFIQEHHNGTFSETTV
jgi:predicted DNA-binding ribbon-helix-helix protein